MALENIGLANAGDAFYRYKMPKLLIKLEGKGNGIKTVLPNLIDVANALERPVDYLFKYFIYEIGVSSKIVGSGKTQSFVLMGNHTLTIKTVLNRFIERYVQCKTCGNPETRISMTKKRIIFMACKACGDNVEFASLDRMGAYISSRL
jgi:translation initiation factor 5